MQHDAGRGIAGTTKRNAYIVTIVILVALCACLLLRAGILPHRSIEVAFTDSSPDGLQIVPASCPSAPPAMNSQGLGYYIPPGTYGAQIYGQGHVFCITNSGSNYYFLPFDSTTEVNDFIAAIVNHTIVGVVRHQFSYYH